MPNPKSTTTNSGEIMHYSVGAIIKNDDKYLIIKRAKPPIKFAGVAGHVDAGENADDAIVREVFEESGFKVETYKLLIEKTAYDNPCTKGTKIHHWYIYACEVSGEIIRNYEETNSIGWYTPEEIKQLDLEPVWRNWFSQLNII